MLGSDPIQFNEDEDNLDSAAEGSPTNSSDGIGANRPAANANLSEKVDATTEEFDFKEDADDFLGLEDEVDVMTKTAGGAAEAEEDGLGLADGWLLEVASGEAEQASTEEASTEAVSAENTDVVAEAEQLVDSVSSELAEAGIGELELSEEATDYEEDDDFEYGAEEGEYDEEYDDEYDEDYEGELDEDGYPLEEGEVQEGATAFSRHRTLMIASFAAGILGTITLLMMDSVSEELAPGTEVATATQPGAAQNTGTATGADGSVSGDAAGGSASAGNDGEPIENMLEGLLATPVEGADQLDLEPVTFEAAPMQPMQFDSVDSMPGLPGLPGMSAEQLADLDIPKQSVPRTTLAQIQQASETGDVRGFMQYKPEAGSSFIWTGSEVPMDSIAAEGRVLTPAVGVVRVTMLSGELFEGNLYAVGSNRVWVEMGPGRVGLDGSKVNKIERIIKSPAATQAEEAALGQRVRIRTAGGVMYGKVKSRDGNRVTIVTDKGARITLDNPKIEAIGRLSGLVLN